MSFIGLLTGPDVSQRQRHHQRLPQDRRQLTKLGARSTLHTVFQADRPVSASSGSWSGVRVFSASFSTASEKDSWLSLLLWQGGALMTLVSFRDFLKLFVYLPAYGVLLQDGIF